jgi:kindlin 2
LYFFRPKRFTLKSYKRLFFVCKNLYLLAYKSSEAARTNGDLLFSVPLKGCEVRKPPAEPSDRLILNY